MVESARSVWLRESVEGKNPKNMQWNKDVKAAVKRKEAAWKGVLGARDKDTKERYLEVYKKRIRERLKDVYIREKR